MQAIMAATAEERSEREHSDSISCLNQIQQETELSMLPIWNNKK